MSNGKGDTRRPRAITSAEEAQRWDATFGRNTASFVEGRCIRCGWTSFAGYLPDDGSNYDHECRATVKKRDT